MVGYCDWPAGPGLYVVVIYNEGVDGAWSSYARGVGGVGDSLVDLSLADVNEDGYDDVVVAAPDVSAVAVFPGTANGEVDDQVTVATPAPPG